ncbi:F-box protein SNE-like [Salvia hispanica]|uniref:F-box protein SNE-like n=1 Tax=Salvia hispanica TaxID=49212 RepID=UPI0020096C4A|nr:F-box protein SNE-like [Salvia hispanica]
MDIKMMKKKKKCKRFSINDNMDVLIEILKRLDEKSMGVAACVCRLWCALTRNDALWEHLCFRQLSPPREGVRTVVAALGGYRRLYTLCVKPVLTRLANANAKRTTHEVDLSLSLFCVDYYERLFLAGAATPPSSLIFLCKAG